MTIESLDVVLYTAVFILPGFIMCSIIDALNPEKKRLEGQILLRCLLLSIFSDACLSWYYSLMIKWENLREIEALYWIVLVLGASFLSSLLAFAIALIKQKELIYRLLRKIGLNVVHPIQTAWDYVFSEEVPQFVIVTLAGDEKVYGWYSSQSFTSSDFEERDMYIEKTYTVGDDGIWNEDNESCGIYISKDQIKFIEFKKASEQNVKEDNRGISTQE